MSAGPGGRRSFLDAPSAVELLPAVRPWSAQGRPRSANAGSAWKGFGGASRSAALAGGASRACRRPASAGPHRATPSPWDDSVKKLVGVEPSADALTPSGRPSAAEVDGLAQGVRTKAFMDRGWQRSAAKPPQRAVAGTAELAGGGWVRARRGSSLAASLRMTLMELPARSESPR